MASSHQSTGKPPGQWFEQGRLFLIGGLCFLAITAIAKQHFSEPAEVATQTFPYPDQVTLPGWQLINAEVAKTKGKPPGRQYTFRKGDLTATITTYAQPASDGNVSRLLVAYTNAKPAIVQIHTLKHPQTGYLGAFIFENQAHISACVNPQGISTVTEQQFVRNKYSHNLNLLPWLMGQEDLTDGRCLWTLISTAIAPDATPEENTQTFQQLETAWVEWYQWWHNQSKED